MVERLRQNITMAVESYPDECWLFDHAMALASLRLADYLDGTDHSGLCQDWLAVARKKLTHSGSGMLVSSYSLEGKVEDGPEGSTIWFSAHCLRLVDETFAREQYDLARKELGRELFGMAWSREWPSSWQGERDIDSGAVIPVLEISARGSGLAFIAAASFKDEGFLQHLHTTLDFAGFPERKNGSLRYCASNQVGDSVMLYSMVLGPIWKKVLNHKR